MACVYSIGPDLTKPGTYVFGFLTLKDHNSNVGVYYAVMQRKNCVTIVGN